MPANFDKLRESDPPVCDVESAVRWQLTHDTTRMAQGCCAVLALTLCLTFSSLPWTYPELVPAPFVEFCAILLVWCAVYAGLLHLARRRSWPPGVCDWLQIAPLVLLEGLCGWFYGSTDGAARLGIMTTSVTPALTIVYFVPRRQRIAMVVGMPAARLLLYFIVQPHPAAAAIDDHFAQVAGDATLSYMWLSSTFIFSSAALVVGDMVHRFAAQLAHVRWRERARACDLEAMADAAATRLDLLQGQTRSVRLDERSRIARELHDELGQVIAALGLELEAATVSSRAGSLGLATTQDALLRMGKLATRARESLIDVIGGLVLQRKLRELGLRNCLDQLVRDFTRHSHLATELQLSTDDSKASLRGSSHTSELTFKLDDALAHTVYRIVQEALTNIHRHAHATATTIVVDAGSRGVQLRICDDGVGISPDAGVDDEHRFGLRGIRERAESMGGYLALASRVQGGLELIVELPPTCGGDSP